MAFSGGPDSTALLVALQEAGRDPIAAHFDHDLRSGSADSAVASAAFAQSLGVRFIVGRRAEPLARGSLQAAARAQRYRFLEHVAGREEADWIAFGHTADDVIEGAALHLLRGCALAGLRGMPERRGRIVRPFLAIWRTEIEGFLAERNLRPQRDPSNFDRRHARVAVRLDLLPALERDRPGLKRRLLGAAQAAARLQCELEERAQADPASSANAAVRGERYRRLFAASGAALPALGRSHLAAMDRLAESRRTGASLDLPQGRRFRVLPDGVEIGIARAPWKDEAPALQITECRGQHCPPASARTTHLDSEQLANEDLRIAHRTPGLRLRPHPTSGTRKLQDLFVDAKVPRHLRDTYPLVFAGDTLVWVPGIATHAPYQAKANSRRVHVELV